MGRLAFLLLMIATTALRVAVCCQQVAAQERAVETPDTSQLHVAADRSLAIPPGDWVLVQATSGDWLHTPEKPPSPRPLFGPGSEAPLEEPAKKPDDPPVPWPDISQPGPDMGDFPNSAYTLPKGKAYIELAPFMLSGPNAENPSSYSTPYLLRYGVTDDVEFRLFGSGFTRVYGSHPASGFSPLSLDTKIHLWDQNNDWFIPAVSFEAYLQTNWGTKAFDGGWQESIALNFDMLLTKKTNLEWTIGYSGVRDAVNVVSGNRFIPRHGYLHPVFHRENATTYQFSIQWALEHEVTDRLQVFTHGFLNGGILVDQGPGLMVGGGAFWKFSSRLIGWGSCNASLDEINPPVMGQVGFAIAL
jgi:hypothetical protein